MNARIILPNDLSKLGGPSAEDVAEVLARRERKALADLVTAPEGHPWAREFETVVAQFQHDGETLKALRVAVDQDFREFRVPLWIQDPEPPDCCGCEMVFVGQLDDATVCEDAPAGAAMWWHDRASFYVFSCPQCLGVKAVGQQF